MAQLPASLQKSLDDTKVDYVNLGGSGLRISVPVLGTMGLGSSKWERWVLDEEPSLEILKAAYDRGINTWDTANMYSNGISEEVIGKAIHKFNIPREKLVIMTKCWTYVSEDPTVITPIYLEQMARSKDYVNNGGLSRAAIFNAVEASLRRLGTSYVDVFQIHRFDPATPIEETMLALHDLIRSNKVRYIGASSMWASQFARMQEVARSNGWTPFISMQNYYNVCYREEEREMLRYCRDTGVGIIPWSPLFGGKLARPLSEKGNSLRANVPSPLGDNVTTAEEEIIRRVEEVAHEKKWKMSQVALVWLRSKGAVPIVGFNSVSRIDDACGIRGKELTEDEIKYLEEPYVPRAIVGHF
ncbi:Aldo-keto reductase [Pleurostoma richardsiae]|uniref:Aldo-keto reductase n=1 Tax=Pleurostoma richardsiae TaxID=41990 RepID=A0AA38RCX1_9PEZI|nr:Aldo-keto reductase [Pleurostoma richardsiae]